VTALAFVERPEQLRLVPPGHRVVALNPAVTVEAELAGREFTRPEEYVPDEEIESGGLANFAHVESIARAIDELAAQVTKDEEITPGTWGFFWLKILFDAVWLRARYVEAILDRDQPSSILYFRLEPAPDDDPVTTKGSIYNTVVASASAKRGLATRRIDSPPAGAKATPPILSRLIRAARARAGSARRRAHLELAGRRKGRSRVLCLDYGYHVPHVAKELRRAGWDVEVWTGLDSADAPFAELLWAAMLASPQMRDLFVRNDIDLWEPALPHLRRLVVTELSAAAAEYKYALEYLQQNPADVVLTSMVFNGVQNARCTAARRAWIPTVVHRHGAVGLRDLPLGAFVDLTDWALCWGDWEASWVTHHTNGRVTPVVTGAPFVEAAAAAARSRRTMPRKLGEGQETVVVYAPTALSGNGWYANRRAPSDGSYFDQQKQIVADLTALDVSVVVKEHPGEDDPSPLARWCAHAYGGSVSIIRRPPFADLVHLANAVVIDAPFTTLVQAMFGTAHVYVVDHPVIDWSPGVVNHLRAHGVRICATEELGEQIRRDAANGRFEKPALYDDEARGPMMSGSAPGSAVRAARALIAIGNGLDPRAS